MQDRIDTEDQAQGFGLPLKARRLVALTSHMANALCEYAVDSVQLRMELWVQFSDIVIPHLHLLI